jgi:transcriptional regulator of arginine metabolism
MNAVKKVLDQAIIKLVSRQSVTDQATLIRLLAEEGFNLTQGTLSRRMARLSIRKRGGRYQRVPVGSNPVPGYTFAQSSPNLLILQTHHGHGHALAQHVDRNAVPGIAGTVVSEDSLFIALHAHTSLEEIQAQVEGILGPPLTHL